jgi:hypothetical protein
MALLFIVALVLAWPTAGLSIVAWVVWCAARAYLRARVDRYEINSQLAIRDLANGQAEELPSWTANKDKVDVFLNGVLNAAQRKGVAKAYIATTLTNEGTAEMVLKFAGQMERRGSSFLEQQAGTAAFVEKMWIRLDRDTKSKLLAMSS